MLANPLSLSLHGLRQRMQFGQLKRRDFITLLGATVAGWPLAARAQQPEMPVVGFISNTSPETIAERLRAFHLGLKESGYVDGENVAILHRWTDNRTERLSQLTTELIQRKVTVIAATGSVAQAIAQAVKTIPIVFSVPDDPVRLGLVASLARPGGNATGVNFFSSELVAKRLEYLRELVPGATRIAVLVNPGNATTTETTLREAEVAGRTMGLQIHAVRAGTSSEINAAFATFAREKPNALFVANDGFYSGRRVQLANLASRHALPAAFHSREIVEVGGLLSYGTNMADAYHQQGAYVGRILKGAKPEDLPVVQSSKFELVINAETARMLGLTVPPTLLAIADEVIE
jgi:putative ABC transport system substrate-binding protein